MAGFLEKLWDETIAGPTPDLVNRGIRNFQSQRSNGPPKLNSDPVSRSITLLRTRSLPVGPGSDPSSPRTPGTPSEDMRRFSRKGPPAMEAIEDADPTSPTDFNKCVGSLRSADEMEMERRFWHEN
ncbi:hypothetical protein V2J09_023422 [Rumex salicifolius]